jgi:O-antigen/teichoic acid export membrane protein
MAYLGYGVWALVGQQISNTVIVTIMLWLTVKWRPKLMFSFERLKGLFSYGWKLLISALVDTLYVDLRQLIIGKKYSAEDLACYNKGDHFPKFVALNINSSIDGVLFPVLSSQQNNRERVKAMTRKSIKISTFVVAPLMIGLAVCARPVVQLLLGDQWLGCVLFMQILCISYLFYPIHTANLNAVKAMGRSDYFLKLEIVKKAVGLAALFSTMWISVEAMVYSLLATTVISTMINAFPNKKLLQYSWFEQMRDILPILALAAGMGAVVYCLNFLPLPTIAVLALQIVTGGVIYIGISVLLKLEIFTYLWGTAKEILKRRKQH